MCAASLQLWKKWSRRGWHKMGGYCATSHSHVDGHEKEKLIPGQNYFPSLIWSCENLSFHRLRLSSGFSEEFARLIVKCILYSFKTIKYTGNNK
jgi:hypothetical protein